MSKALKLLGFLAVTVFLFSIVALLAAYHLIRTGEVREFLRAEIEKRTDLRARLGAADLELGWITEIAFSDLALTEPGAAGPAITAQKVTAHIALWPLLNRQLVIDEITFESPSARLVREQDGRVPLLDKLLGLHFWKDDGGEFSLDLRSIKVTRGEIAIIDARRDQGFGEWRAAGVQLNLERLHPQRLAAYLHSTLKRQAVDLQTVALAFELNAVVARAQARMNLTARGQLAFLEKPFEFHKAYWDGDIDVVNLPAALVAEYLGAHAPLKSVSGYLAQRLHIQGNLESSLQARGSMQFRQLSIDAPELLLAPLERLDGRADFTFERSRRDLRIKRAEVRTGDVAFSFQAVIAGTDTADPQLRLSVAAASAPARSVLRYMPLGLIETPTLKTAVSGIQNGQIELKSARLDMPLSQLRQRAAALRNISAETELRDLAATPLHEGTLPLRGVSGAAQLANGILNFKNFSGTYGAARFYEIAGSYDLAGEKPGTLALQGRGEIDLAEMKNQLKLIPWPSRVTNTLDAVRELSGRAKVALSVKHGPNMPDDLTGNAAFERVRLRLDNVMLEDLSGELAFTPESIEGEQIEAQLAGSPVKLRLALHRYQREDGTFDLEIASKGIKAETVSAWLIDNPSGRDSGIVRGTVRYTGPIADRKGRKFTGELELVDVQLLVKPLLQPLGELVGKISIGESGIVFHDLRGLLAGAPAIANGHWRYDGKPQLLFDFVAPSLDITQLISQIDPESSEFYANLVAEGKIALGKGRIKNFDFTELRTNASIDRRVWRLTQLSAIVAGGTISGVATIFDKPNIPEIAAAPRVQDVPVEAFLKWFDMTNTEMTGKVNLTGKLASVGKNDTERKQNLNGAFQMKIQEGTIHRMRILVQILNLLDLSRWFTLQLPDLAKDGIRFRAITADFKVVQGVYATENLVVDSNDLRMTGTGKIDVPKDHLDFVVAVRPFAGIDSALSYVPLLGRSVAAIKNSFLVASFNIQGPIENPTITPAPLGTVAEWVWGVLGIPKNMIGWGEGEKKSEPPPAQAPAR